MLAAAVIKELKLLSRDLHGVAVLFVMPIVFMLIMSAALSSDSDNLRPHAQIILLGNGGDTDAKLQEALQVEGWRVYAAPLSDLKKWQQALQNGQADLLVANPNASDTPLEKEQPLQLWLRPDADRAWLLGAKGVLRQHYTRIRLDSFLAERQIRLDNAQSPPVRQIQQQVDKSFEQTRKQVQNHLQQNLWQETYLNRQGQAVKRPNSVQHSVPAWLILVCFLL